MTTTAYFRDYYQANKEKIAVKTRAYRLANREKIAASKAAHYAANREAIIANQKAYALANAEKVAAYQKAYAEERAEHLAAYRREYYESHPEVYRKATTNRRARKADAFVEAIDPEVVFQRDLGVCGICDLWVLATDKWHVDHVQPLAKGGPHSYDNVQLAHAKCNLVKKDKWVAA